MIPLENIVRPYQRPIVLNAGRVISRAVAPSADTAVMTWGALGTLPTAVQEDDPNPQNGFNVELCDTDYHETKRTVEQTRISNPSDGEQFVMIDRIRSMSFRVTERAKVAGAIRSETTVFDDTGFGGSLESIKKSDNCKSNFVLAGQN